ncbi:MAG: TraR/DksA family transcriptional regulator [Candidatus Marinimicrobia bacterium]|jgi:RNA polymerase-binding protein DksA|nr:TraR/DksA family transcriptional regulator [Candidatus Neomarinimicrobiota bacterium]MDD4961709.1 TraR/DksA family transcriptional regulator [Candidatus Neomarinimicrobiota bacterium]MDD5709267.1 TraR/DksA family transcriptional regulator [Candidatus Neomarinimicrobiota bacterium]MDX9777717.1 TraR/DksA family transcriptional regulator [bacterium]
MTEVKRKGPKLTKAQRKHFREVILAMREEAVRQIETKRESFIDSSPGSSQLDSNYAYHMADVGTDAQEREKAFMQYARENKFLTFLDKALERIENDPNYGYCVECGDRIPDERLDVVPHTTHCVKCKSKIV